MVRYLEYVLALCLIVEFNTPYLIFPSIAKFVRYAPLFILLLLIIYKGKKSRINSNFYLCAVLYSFGSVIPLFVTPERSRFVLQFVIFVLLSWYYLSLKRNDGLDRYSIFFRFSNVVYYISIISIVFWIFGSVLHLLHPNSHILSTWAGERLLDSYFGVYFETQGINLFGLSTCRNSGLFQEGPMYNMVLCVSILIESLLRVQVNKKRVIILAFTILSTFTTTGQIFLLLFVGVYVVNRFKLKRYIPIFLITLPLFVYIFVLITSAIVENKQNDTETGGASSVETRSNSIQACIDTGLDNPLFGVGYYKDISKLEEHSNSIFEVFAYGGLYGVFYFCFVFLCIPVWYYMRTKDDKWPLVMFGIFIVFTVTVSEYTMLVRFVIAWSLSHIFLIKNNKFSYKRLIQR